MVKTIAGIDCFSKETFFDICVSLEFEVSIGDNLKKYYYDEWYGETPWGDTIECSRDTKELIDLINNSNEIKLQEMKSKKPYAYFHEFSTKEEIKNALLKVFEEDPSDTYWKNLDHLMYEMIENDLFAKAINSLKSENHPISISSKIKHCCMAYDEISYDYQMQKQLEEAQRNNQNYDNL